MTATIKSADDDEGGVVRCSKNKMKNKTLNAEFISQLKSRNLTSSITEMTICSGFV